MAFKLQQLSPNGGRSSSTKVKISSTGKERLLMSMRERILKDKKSSCGKNIKVSTRNGRLSTLKHSKHKRVRDTVINGDSISIDHSL
jgi:hypothetical protein